MDSLWTAERSAWTRPQSPVAVAEVVTAVAEDMEAAVEDTEAAVDMEEAAAAVTAEVVVTVATAEVAGVATPQVEAEATAGTSLVDMGTGTETAMTTKLLSTRFQPAPSSTPNKEALCQKPLVQVLSFLFSWRFANRFYMLNLLACIFVLWVNTKRGDVQLLAVKSKANLPRCRLQFI